MLSLRKKMTWSAAALLSCATLVTPGVAQAATTPTPAPKPAVTKVPLAKPAVQAPAKPKPQAPALRLDKRCLTGRVVCVDSKARKMTWVVNGKALRTVNVRLGRPGMRTKLGVHRIYWKHKNHVSSTYGSPMPYSQFFYKGQALHFNGEWAKKGYGVGSHGCVSLRSMEEARWLWHQTRVGDKVVVY